jgi:hypothetical protein
MFRGMNVAAVAEDQSPFRVFNIRPELSGLPFIVWISEKGGARHDVRVKVSPGPRVREFAATISVRPQIEIIAGELSTENLRAVRAWIELNRETIIKYWNGEILYTDEALAALKPLPPQS